MVVVGIEGAGCGGVRTLGTLLEQLGEYSTKPQQLLTRINNNVSIIALI